MFFCPSETAEIETIRSRSVSAGGVFQAQHLAGVMNYVLNLAHNRDFSLAIISRGLIDMLYWYEKFLMKGLCDESHVNRATDLHLTPSPMKQA